MELLGNRITLLNLVQVDNTRAAAAVIDACNQAPFAFVFRNQRAGMLEVHTMISLYNSIVLRYYYVMIKSFADKETEKVWDGQVSRKLPHDIQTVARRKLRMLNNSHTLVDLKVPPANRLEALSGNREGQYSIRINDQWRICFSWQNGDCFDVTIIDYH